MRFRAGLVLGFGGGYVLGAKAGHQRYQEIMRYVRNLSRSEQAQELKGTALDAASQAADVLEQKANDGAEKVAQLVTNAQDGGNSAAR